MNEFTIAPQQETTRGSMSTWVVGIVGLVLIVAAGVGVYLWQQRTIDDQAAHSSALSSQLAQARGDLEAQKQSTLYTSVNDVQAVIYTPLRDAQVTSPLVVMGQIPGSWSFEASFPVELLDNTGKSVAHAPAHLLGDWTTDELVPFSVSLDYSNVAHGAGALVLHKDNPSGKASADDTIRIPVEL